MIRPPAVRTMAIALALLWGGLACRQVAEQTAATSGDADATQEHGASPTMKEDHPSGSPHGKPNRLIHEKSPYLQQHAYNPVDWYPWGDEALARAKAENKPIFLSIGYSTCHWCHVMERESFENPEIAALMNQFFVNVKVDREERPDLDQIYMNAVQAMTGRGGWPMSVWLTPDLEPFVGGTYFPPEDRWGRAGFTTVITRINELWTDPAQRANLIQTGKGLTAQLRQHAVPAPGGGELSRDLLTGAYRQLTASFDARDGGFGGAPKFPRSMTLMLLMRYHAWKGDDHALRMTEVTLRKMADGGIYDHLGDGFHRYSTDAQWLAPHFEKMLYDNAILARTYLEAYQLTGKQTYADTARGIFTYVLRDMVSPDGGFYSAEDADSEGEEGKFYVWDIAEVRQVLGPDAALFCDYYNVRQGGNWEGHSILHVTHPLPAVAGRNQVSEETARNKLAAARAKLLAVRDRRIRPGLDDKILTDWNGLMVGALALGAQVLEEPTYLAAARKAADFILTTLQRDGELLHRYRDGEARFPAYLDDYAYFIQGLLDLYEADFDPRWLQEAVRLQAVQQKRFWDKSGGYFFTPPNQAHLLVRSKEAYDGARPSGNAIAALNLVRLAEFTGTPEYRTQAVQTLSAFLLSMQRQPTAQTQMLCAVDFLMGAPQEIILVGRSDHDATRAMLRAIRKRFLPNKVVVQIEKAASRELLALMPMLAEKTTPKGKTTAYVCENFTCKLPTTEVAAMEKQLEAKDS